MDQHFSTPSGSGPQFEIFSLNDSLNSSAGTRNKIFCPQHFQLLWITSASGRCTIRDREIELLGNQLLFLRPGQPCHFENDDLVFGHRIIFIESFIDLEDTNSDSAYYHCLFQLLSAAPVAIISHEILEEAEDIIARILQEFNNSHLFKMEILRRYFKIFLMYLGRQFEENFKTCAQTRQVEIVQRFTALLEKNYLGKKMVADYAGLLSVTPNYLNELVKKETGFTASHHIRQRIISEAKRKAMYTDMCMKEVAYYLGFSGIAHFSKFFKNSTGANFSQFRKEKVSMLLVPAMAG